MIGNTRPDRLGEAVVSVTERQHLLAEQIAQGRFFQSNPNVDPRTAFPQLRWVRLKGAGVWVSYGELNALGDYFPNAARIDSEGASIMVPVLQRMRRGVVERATSLLAADRGEAKVMGKYLSVLMVGEFAGEATAHTVKNDVSGMEEDLAMDKATKPMGSDRYLSVVARNACHFAPFSWQRWAHFHNEARGFAVAAHAGKDKKLPLKDVDTSADENVRQAWLQNGYGDHFLQDSFAAGHLANKTLVMQWFVDYVNGLSSKWWDLVGGFLFDRTKPWHGMPDDSIMDNMGSKKQPEMAGRHLYGKPPTAAGTARADWAVGSEPTDPQSAQERSSREQRVMGSGVKKTAGSSVEENYQAYLGFLNNTFIGMAAGNVHDKLNDEGLTVRNDRGDTFRVGGDGTMLTLSSHLGAQLPAEAAQLSQKAIDDTLRTGTTAITVEQIWSIFPNSVGATKNGASAFYPLEQFQDEILRAICIRDIFPDVVDSFSSKVVRAMRTGLSEGAIGESGDREGPVPAPPLPDDLGDFPLFAGNNIG